MKWMRQVGRTRKRRDISRTRPLLAMNPQSTEPVLASVANEERPLAFFHEMHQAFQLAAASAGMVDRCYKLGGYIVRLCFAGDALVPVLSPALSHMATAAAQPDLTICLWDSASTGVRMPPTPWRQHYAVRGEVEGYNTDRVYTVYEHESCGLSMLDNARNLAVLWVAEPGRIPYWVKGSPLRTILHWWMGGHGRQLVHSAAVGTSGGGVLITGKSGSGKSTTALACLESGLLYAGDDYVIVSADPLPHAFSLYNTAKVVPERLDAFPRLAAYIDNADRLDTEKALVFIKGAHAMQLSAGFPLNAVLVPRVTGIRDTIIRKTSPAVSLAALAPSTIFAHPRGGEAEFRFLARLVKRLPAYVIECGTELAQIPQAITDLLSGSIS
jgi:hypothetical protein